MWWLADWYTGTNISEGYGAVILGLEHEGSAMLVTVYQFIQRHSQESSIFNIKRAFQTF